MNTQTHVIMGAVLFGKPVPRLAWAGAAGAIVPDLPMYVIIGALRIQGYGLDRIFGEIYWEDWWQIANAIGHNIPLWFALSAITTIALIRIGNHLAAASSGSWSSFKAAFEEGGPWALAFAFSGAALLSSLTDLPLHRGDGHMHFWPFSTWRFNSPVSYWDPNHHGIAFSLFEAALGITLAVILIRRYKNIGVRIALMLLLLAYIAVPAFYFWSLGGHEGHQRSNPSVEPVTGDKTTLRHFGLAIAVSHG